MRRSLGLASRRTYIPKADGRQRPSRLRRSKTRSYRGRCGAELDLRGRVPRVQLWLSARGRDHRTPVALESIQRRIRLLHAWPVTGHPKLIYNFSTGLAVSFGAAWAFFPGNFDGHRQACRLGAFEIQSLTRDRPLKDLPCEQKRAPEGVPHLPQQRSNSFATTNRTRQAKN
jgi:hypothetical protein